MRNVQQRQIDAPAHTLGSLLDAVATPQDQLWPTRHWPPLTLDAGLAPGSSGGHGPIRYHVTAHEPGRRVRFEFAPGMGLVGYHEFTVTPEGSDRCRVTHVIDAAPRGRMLLLWPFVVRWLHEALTHDLFDNAERAATGRLHHPPARWSRWVRLLRSFRSSRRKPGCAEPA